jgi:hypothetical protein
MITAELEAAYRSTHYVVDAGAGPGEGALVDPIVLEIDVPSPALLALHRRRGVDCSCFITAFNPFSRPLDAYSNQQRLDDLAAELRHRSLAYLSGEGRHPSNGWPAEPSFLVLGLALEAAKSLGRGHEQNAIVWSGSDAVPRLVMLD